jgi:hypothetical protein
MIVIQKISVKLIWRKIFVDLKDKKFIIKVINVKEKLIVWLIVIEKLLKNSIIKMMLL